MPRLPYSFRPPHSAYGLLAALAVLLAARVARAEHVVASWQTSEVHTLDDDMMVVSSFMVPTFFPNAIASDGASIYVGFPDAAGAVAVYDLAGTAIGTIDVGSGQIAGLEIVDGELFVSRAAQVEVHDAVTGDFVRSLPFPRGVEHLEGLGFDGELLWVVGPGTLHGIDPEDGAVVATLESDALGCSSVTGGVAASGPDELTIVCGTGDWWVISSVDGSVLDEGNNGIDMFGSAYFSLAECGDAVVEGDEECDEALSATCDTDCTFVVCGDGTINPLAAEECDDGNVIDGDGCNASCTVELPGTSDDGSATESSGTADSGTTLDTSESTSTAADTTQGTSSATANPHGSSDGDDEGSTTDAPSAIGSDAGCGCRNTAPRGWVAWAIALVGLRRRAGARSRE